MTHDCTRILWQTPVTTHARQGEKHVIQTSDIHLDFDAFARRFAEKCIHDAGAAVALWRETVADLPDDLRTALGRLVNGRLGYRERGALRQDAGGFTLALQWEIARALPPQMPRLPFFSAGLAYGYCAGVIEERASATAREALRRGQFVLLALRKPTSTLANKGRGVYDDIVAVLNGRGGRQGARLFPACTEPGAQYSARAATTSAGARVDARYAKVVYKKTEGADWNQDGIADLGRLSEGTYFFNEKTDGFLHNRAFEANADQTVERDINGDGFFDEADGDRRFDSRNAGRSLYIHIGGRSNGAQVNTWSAGCQTIPGDVYADFLATLGPRATFFYVLVNTR